MSDDADFAGLLCARLCHDLVSPVGAIGNGLELLGAAGGAAPEDYALLNDSATAARATLAFMRLAFGAVAPDAPEIGGQELGRIVGAYFADRRQKIVWPEGDAPLGRGAAKLLCLMLLAATTATPRGGSLAVAPPGDAPLALGVSAEGPRAGFAPEAAALLADPSRDPMSPREAHLTLLARTAARAGATLSVTTDAERVTLRVAG